MARLRSLLGRIEQRGATHLGSERPQRRLDDAQAILAVLLGSEVGVAADVLDAAAAHHAVGTRRQGQVVDGRDHGHRDARALDLLGDRCPATIAGPSRGDEKTGPDLGLAQLVGDASSQQLGLGHGRAHAGQRVGIRMHGADRPRALQLAHVAQGQDVVGIGVHQVSEVPDVIGLPLAPAQALELIDGIAKVLLGVARGLPVGIADGHEPAGGDEGEGDPTEIRDRRSGLHDLRRLVRDLADVRSPVELGEEHVDRAAIPPLRPKTDLADAAAQKASSLVVRKVAPREDPGYRRAVDMLLAKLHGRPNVSEIPYQAPEIVEPAPPAADLRRIALALVTTGGLVPIGNPDGQTSGNAQKYFRYSIDQLQSLRRGEWEAYHVGYFTHLVNTNPNYVLPLGYMRELERAGTIGSVHPYAYTLPGVSTPVAQSELLGRGIADQLREAKVGACLLVST